MRQNNEGIRTKYIVHKAGTGEEVNNCFVLRPDRDAAAVTAIRAYAAVTENKTLAADLIRWVGVEHNDPLTLEQLREMAWSQSQVWCSDTDGLHAGLMCIRDDWYEPERTPHIWLLDEEGNSGVYSAKTLLDAGARFYRRKPEDGTT